MKRISLLSMLIMVFIFATCKKDPIRVTASPLVVHYDTTTTKADSIYIYFLDAHSIDTVYDITYGCSFITLDTLGNRIDSILVTSVGWNDINNVPSDISLRNNIIPINSTTGAPAVCIIVSSLKVRTREKTILQIKDYKRLMCSFVINSTGITGDPYQSETHTIGSAKNAAHKSQIFIFS